MPASYRNYEHLWLNPRSLDLVTSLREGWLMFHRSPVAAVIFTLLAAVIGLVGLILQAFLPLVGSIFVQALITVLLAGYYHVGYKLFRKETAGVSDFFSGFDVLGQAVILVLIQLGIALVLLIPVMGMGIVAGMGLLEFGESLLGIALGMSIFLLFFAFTLAYLFAIPNLINLKLAAWDAMELSRRVAFKCLPALAGLFLLLVLLNILGGITLLGWLATVPLSLFVIQAAWEQLIGHGALEHFEGLLEEMGNDEGPLDEDETPS